MREARVADLSALEIRPVIGRRTLGQHVAREPGLPPLNAESEKINVKNKGCAHLLDLFFKIIIVPD